MELPITFIGWFFTVTSAAALSLGAALIFILVRAGGSHRRQLSYSFVNDAMLAAVWLLGLFGGIGVIRLQPWGRYLLELFCWALMVLLILSAVSRIYALRRPEAQPINWVSAIAGITLILIPVLAICAATIITLRSPEALKAFS
jgi:hypothetical protein